MIAVKNSETTTCFYADNWCVEFSCVYNRKFELGQEFPGTRGIPWVKCIAFRIRRKLAIFDKSNNVLARERMEPVFIKKQCGPLPSEIAEFLYGKSPEMVEPSPFWLTIEDT